MLSKKPLGGYSCASCEKQIRNLSLQPNSSREDYNVWNKLPQREPIAKLGAGFSKILALIKPGGVGGGGNSLMGTARHVINESQSQTNLTSILNQGNIIVGKSSLEEDYNTANASMTSQMNTSAPNFNAQDELTTSRLQVIGSQTARQASLPPQIEGKDDRLEQQYQSMDKTNIESQGQVTIYNKPRLSKGPMMVKGGKIGKVSSQSSLP